MIKLVQKLVSRGTVSFDIYLDDVKLECSVISSIRFRPNAGLYKLKIDGDEIRMKSCKKGRYIGCITVGNGVYNVKGCRMFIGELTAGVLCVRGRQHYEQLVMVLRRINEQNRMLEVSYEDHS